MKARVLVTKEILYSGNGFVRPHLILDHQRWNPFRRFSMASLTTRILQYYTDMSLVFLARDISSVFDDSYDADFLLVRTKKVSCRVILGILVCTRKPC